MDYAPLDDRIFVERIDRGEKETAGGLIIPDASQELGDCAEVVEIGPGKRQKDNPSQRDPIELTVGDTVIISRYAGTEFSVNGRSLLVIRADDVLATVDEAAVSA